jgi:septum formation protein
VFELILASASARRAALLRQIGVPFRVVTAAEVEPLPEQGESAERFAVRAASAKVTAVAGREVGRICLGADTVVVGPREEILGKPRHAAHAMEMLESLAGHWHRVVTGMVLAGSDPLSVAPDGWRGLEDGGWSHWSTTRVRFRALERAEIQRYVASGEPFGKAGGYAIQGLGAGLVEAVEGSYFNVVGLPVVPLIAALRGWFEWPPGEVSAAELEQV